MTDPAARSLVLWTFTFYPLLGMLSYALTCIQLEVFSKDLHSLPPQQQTATRPTSTDFQATPSSPPSPPPAPVKDSPTLPSPPPRYVHHRSLALEAMTYQFLQVGAMIQISRGNSRLMTDSDTPLLPAATLMGLLTLFFVASLGELDTACQTTRRVYDAAGWPLGRLAWMQPSAMLAFYLLIVPWWILLRALW